MALRKTDVIRTLQLHRRPTGGAKALTTVLLRPYSPALQDHRKSSAVRHDLAAALGGSRE